MKKREDRVLKSVKFTESIYENSFSVLDYENLYIFLLNLLFCCKCNKLLSKYCRNG